MRQVSANVWKWVTAAIGSQQDAASIQRRALLLLMLCAGILVAVIATTAVAAALADWRLQTRIMAAAVLSAVTVALMRFMIVRHMNQQNRESQQRLQLHKQQIDTALNNMTQGLVLYDATARIILCNRRYIDMYKLSTDVAKPGCHFFDLIRHRQQTGSFDGDVEEFCSS